MSYDLYWHGDPSAVKAYRKAYDIKRHKENETLWLQGRYIYEALLDVAPILRAFSKAKQPEPYLTEPYPLTLKELKEREAKKERETFFENKAKVEAWMKRVNHGHDRQAAN